MNAKIKRAAIIAALILASACGWLIHDLAEQVDRQRREIARLAYEMDRTQAAHDNVAQRVTKVERILR